MSTTVHTCRTNSAAKNTHYPLMAICTSIMMLAALINRNVPTSPATLELSYAAMYPNYNPQHTGLIRAVVTLLDGMRLISYLIIR